MLSSRCKELLRKVRVKIAIYLPPIASISDLSMNPPHADAVSYGYGVMQYKFSLSPGSRLMSLPGFRTNITTQQRTHLQPHPRYLGCAIIDQLIKPVVPVNLDIDSCYNAVPYLVNYRMAIGNYVESFNMYRRP